MLLLTVLSGRNRPGPDGNALLGGDTGLRAGRDGPRSVGQREWVGAGVAVAVMLLLVLNTRMLVDIHHQSHFLMPVVDLINGKSLLADINAQYGVGVHYLIGMLFLWNPVLISFPAFTFVTNLGELALAAGLFALVGLSVKTAESAQIASFLPVFPLTFAASTFVPLDSMPGWLQVFARNQPVSHAVNAVRKLTQGSAVQGINLAAEVWLTLAWSGGITIVFATLAIRKYRKVD